MSLSRFESGVELTFEIDDILITDTGYENLTTAIKDVDEMEEINSHS